MLMFGYLRRAEEAYTLKAGKGKEKKAARLATNRTASCAHGSARFALQGVRRSRPRWELFGLISFGQIVREYRVGLTSMISEVNT